MQDSTGADSGKIQRTVCISNYQKSRFMRITYFPKSSSQTFGIVTVMPTTYSTAKKYMTWIVGHGIGERGDGSQAALQELIGWGGFGNVKNAVDPWDFILVFVN